MEAIKAAWCECLDITQIEDASSRALAYLSPTSKAHNNQPTVDARNLPAWRPLPIGVIDGDQDTTSC